MDPISFGVTAFELVTTVGKVVIAIQKYAASVKEAEQSRTRMLQELSAINGALMNLHRR